MTIKSMSLWLAGAAAAVACALVAVTILSAPADAGASTWIAAGGQALLGAVAIGAALFLRARFAEVAAVAETARAIAVGGPSIPPAAQSAWGEIGELSAALESLGDMAGSLGGADMAAAGAGGGVDDDASRQIAAFSQHQAIVEFQPDGTVIRANRNFCDLMGYDPATIAGTRHAALCDAEFARSADYEAFWRKLRGGQFVSG
jgi:PAS domain-containing protein